MPDRQVSKKIKVKITLFSPFSRKTTKDETTMAFEKGSTVKDLILHLVSREDHLKAYLGEVAGEEDIREVVSDGDTLKFLHPLQGG